MGIKELTREQRFKDLSTKDKQRVVGEYFDDNAPSDDRFAGLTDKQKRKMRESFVRDNAPAGVGAIAKAAVTKAGNRALQGVQNTLGNIYAGLGWLQGSGSNPIYSGGNDIYGQSKLVARNAALQSGGRSDDATLETGVVGDIVQGGADIVGAVGGELPNYTIVPGVGPGANLVTKLFGGAIKYGLGSAAASPEGEMKRRLVEGAITGPFSELAGGLRAGTGIIGQQVAPRAAVAGTEATGNILGQLAFTGEVDPFEAAVQAGIGGVVGRTKVPEKVPPPETGLIRRGETDVDVPPPRDSIVTPEQRQLEQPEIIVTPDQPKQIEDLRSQIRSDYEPDFVYGAEARGPIFDVEPEIVENIKTQEEFRAASEGNRGRDPVTSDGVDPDAMRSQIRTDDFDVNPNVIDQPNAPGGWDERHHGGLGIIWNIERGYDNAPNSIKALKNIKDGLILPVIDRFRNITGSDVGKRIASTADEAVSFKQEIRGELSEPLNKLMRKIRGKGFIIPKGAIESLNRKGLFGFNEFDINGDIRVKESNLGIVLNDLDPDVEARLSDSERETVTLLRDLINKRGEIAEREGMLQNTTTGPQPFQNQPGQKIGPRVATDELFGILQMKPGDRPRKAYVKALAHMNNMDEGAVEDAVSAYAKIFSGEEPDAMFASAQFDFQRTFNRVPDVLYVDGKQYQLYETNISRYANRLADGGASTIGFRKAFGQEIGDQTPITDLKNEFIKEHVGQGRKLTTLFRVLNNMPIENGNWNLAEASGVMRAFAATMSVFKALNLTGTAVINIPESFATSFTKYPKAYMKALKDVAFNREQAIAEVEALGLHFRDVFNPTIDPARPYSSAAEILGDAISRWSLVKFANDANGIIAGRTALNQAQLWKRGSWTEADIDKLVAMNYSRAQAKRIVKGDASPKTYDEVARRLARKIPGGVAENAEKSIVENSRMFRSLSAFHTYANSVLRMGLRSIDEAAERVDRILKDPSVPKGKKLAEATKLGGGVLRGATTRAVAGTASVYLTALVIDGLEGEEQNRRRFADDHSKVLMENLAYQTLVGPYGRAASGIFGNNAEQTWKSIYTIGQAAEVFDMLNGSGAYQDSLDFGENFVEFMKRMTPGHKIAANVLGMIGKDKYDQHLEADMKAFYDWRRDRDLDSPGFKPPAPRTEDEKSAQRFNARVRKAVEKMSESGDYIKAREEIIEAAIDGDAVIQELLNSLASEGVSMSEAKDQLVMALNEDTERVFNTINPIGEALKRRKVLTKNRLMPGGGTHTEIEYQAALQDLRNRIGEEAYRRLELHDQMLDLWAVTWVPLSLERFEEFGVQESFQNALQDQQGKAQELATQR